MILVVGATGHVGGMIARRLLEQVRPVRILARQNRGYGALVEAGAEAAPSDVEERASLDAACAGVDTVITTANSAQRGGDDTVESVDLAGNRNLIDAAAAAGVGRFVLTSALGADPASPVPFLRAKGEAEAHLRGSGLPHTILAPNIFMEVWVPTIVLGPVQRGEPVTIVGGGQRRHSFVSAADVAAFAVAMAGHEAARDQWVPLGGPEPLSWHDIVATCERVLGRPIPLRSVEPGEPLPGLPDVVAGLLTAMDSYDSPLDMTATARTHGVRPTPLEEVVRRLVGGPAA